MKRYEFLTRLFEFEPVEAPFASVYLNTEPNETGKKDFEVFLRKQLAEHAGVLAPSSPEAESFVADTEKINEFVGNLDPSTRGVAIFACSQADMFQRFEFEVPFEENSFTVGSRPDLVPIVRLVNRNPAFAVVSADTNEAHIYIFKRGKTIDREDIQNTKTNRSEVGGWSQMRYQRHIDNFHQQHAKEVMEEVAKLVREDRIEYVVLSGDEAVIIPMLRNEMTKEIEGKIAGVMNLNVKAPEHEVLAEGARIVAERHAELDGEKIDQLLEQNYADGLGVVGAEDTLKALLNGQVQEFYMTLDTEDINYSRGQLRAVLKAYEPGEEGELPDAAEKADMVNEFLKRAASTADSIRFIADPQLLKTHGGVGALLRYQAKGVSNI